MGKSLEQRIALLERRLAGTRTQGEIGQFNFKKITAAEIIAGTEERKRSFSPKDVADMALAHGPAPATLEYMVPIWAEENSNLNDNTYEWAFGNGANTPTNAGITIYVPSGWACTIVAMTATTNVATGTSIIEADINGVLQGANCNVQLSGRSGVNDSFTPVAISSGDRLTFRTTAAGNNATPNTVTAWLRYVKT